MTANPVFLDANVFMYAAGAPHAYKAVCVQILADVETGSLAAVINTEILQELLYRYSHIGLADHGVLLCRDILKYPLTVLPITEADVRDALDVLTPAPTSGLKPRDAIHAATMRAHGLSQIISADRDFDRLSFVTRIDPLAYRS